MATVTESCHECWMDCAPADWERSPRGSTERAVTWVLRRRLQLTTRVPTRSRGCEVTRSRSHEVARSRGQDAEELLLRREPRDYSSYACHA